MKFGLNFTIKNNFVRNILILTTGTTVVQLINILLTPILTRIYSPADFGIYGTYNSVLSILMVVSVFKLELVIPIVEDNSLINLLTLSLIINTCFSFATVLVIFCLKFTNFKINLLSDIWIIPIGILGAGTYNIFSYYHIRQKNFKLINKSLVFQSITKNIFQIVLGFLKFGSIGLNSGLIGNYSAGILTLAREKLPLIKANFKSKTLRTDSKHLLVKYKRFPLYLTISGLFNSIGLYIPTPFIIWLYGKDIAGYYAFTVTIVSMPLKIIGTAIGQVFLSEAADLYRNNVKGISILYKKILYKLILIAIPLTIITEIWAPNIFKIVFGLRWQEAGKYVQLLMIGYAFQFVSSPLSQIINILEKQAIQLQWDFIRVILIAGAFASCYFFHLDIFQCLKLLCVVYTISYIYLMLLCWYFALNYDKRK